MSNKIDAAIIKYKNACVNFIKEYIEYNNKNISSTKDGVISVRAEEAVELFGSIGDIIHWSVVMYDTLDRHKINKNDVRFMSGVKHIDNIIKHETLGFEIWDIIRTESKHNLRKNNCIISYQISLVLKFQDISFLPVDKCKDQRTNYNNFIKDQDVNDIISKIDKILAKYISGFKEKHNYKMK